MKVLLITLPRTGSTSLLKRISKEQKLNSISEPFNNVNGNLEKYKDYDWKNTGYLESLSATSRRLVETLLNGGTDPLHLEPHVTDSFRQRDLENTSQRVTQLGESKFLVKYSRYAGWAHNLAREIDLKSMFRSGLDLETEVRVELENFGPLGRFCYSSESGRWFLYSDRYGAPSLQIDAHRWGNPL